MQIGNRQVTKRWWFTLYEKMAAVRNIQQNIKVGDLRKRAACTVANLYQKQFITWKRVITCMQEKRNKWRRLCVSAIIKYAIMASGNMLTPILVFKGMLEGCIATWDFATFPCGCIYPCQKFVWLDELVMFQRVEQVL